MKLYFSIPDFYYNFGINSALLNLIGTRPEMINDNVVIDSIYGSFPAAIWNGGRLAIGVPDSKNVERTLAYFNNRGLSCRYTFTNCLLEEKHVHDTFCNILMQKADNGKNAVIITSDILEGYLREEYPNFEYISSTTKCIRTIDDFNKECEKDYSLCVLHYDFNNNIEELKKIKYPEKTEIILNEQCASNCKRREQHYTDISRTQLNFEPKIGFDNSHCVLDTYCEVMGRKHYISYQDIVETYAPLGFNHFKVVGRATEKVNVIESYVQYFIRPEYQVKARLILSNSH